MIVYYDKTEKKIFSTTYLARLLLLAAGSLTAIWDYITFHNLTRAILWVLCGTVFVISVYAERYLVLFLSEDTLKIIGVILSVLGLLTSFLPAVLDVLCIPLY